MFLNAIGTALPERRYSKSDCWDAFAVSDWFDRLDARSRAIAKIVLTRNNGIEARRLAVESLDEVFAIDADTLQHRFSVHAPRLASAAGRAALQRAGLAADTIDAVVVSTCTGYLCPGLTGYVSESLGLRRNILGFDLVGQGCAGALPNWQLASALLGSGQCEHVLSVCVEVCSAAMYLDNDPGVLISACLFGDGAGAAVLSRRRPSGRRVVEWRGTVSATDPKARNSLRFEHRAGMLRNILTREVPILAAEHAEEVLNQALAQANVRRDQISAWIMHAGGRDVLFALQERLAVDFDALRYSREALREYGNLSSAFVYFVLDAALQDAAPGGWWWMSSFGAGFTCHGALLATE
ncbi:MAG: Chalcone and stilbene synthase domain protein [Gammaproteobacteria bacterium]|nr:Chalcone and stilbene synthase domain protein [Gammaproteobacteria bacterium]